MGSALSSVSNEIMMPFRSSEITIRVIRMMPLHHARPGESVSQHEGSGILRQAYTLIILYLSLV
jgi:hypothetical protein